MKSFSNHFLISMPHMIDPIFTKSLIYICEHNREGAMGLIINKPMVSDNVTNFLQQTGMGCIKPAPEIYFGGPVNLEMGLFLHDANYQIDGTLAVSKTILLTSNKQIVFDLKNGIGPDLFRFSFGYAGWGKGQIEREIENGDWLVMPSDEDFVFSTPDRDKWHKAASKFGIDILDLSGSVGLA